MRFGLSSSIEERPRSTTWLMTEKVARVKFQTSSAWANIHALCQVMIRSRSSRKMTGST